MGRQSRICVVVASMAWYFLKEITFQVVFSLTRGKYGTIASCRCCAYFDGRNQKSFPAVLHSGLQSLKKLRRLIFYNFCSVKSASCHPPGSIHNTSIRSHSTSLKTKVELLKVKNVLMRHFRIRFPNCVSNRKPSKTWYALVVIWRLASKKLGNFVQSFQDVDEWPTI